MQHDFTFDEFVTWLRENCYLPVHKAITPDTQFERDLGLTGDDGTDLLKAAEKMFEVKFANLRETFKLGPNEFLFNSEGWGPSPHEIRLWLSRQRITVRKLTVGELFEAVRRIKAEGRES